MDDTHTLKYIVDTFENNDKTYDNFKEIGSILRDQIEKEEDCSVSWKILSDIYKHEIKFIEENRKYCNFSSYLSENFPINKMKKEISEKDFLILFPLYINLIPPMFNRNHQSRMYIHNKHEYSPKEKFLLSFSEHIVLEEITNIETEILIFCSIYDTESVFDNLLIKNNINKINKKNLLTYILLSDFVNKESMVMELLDNKVNIDDELINYYLLKISTNDHENIIDDILPNNTKNILDLFSEYNESKKSKNKNLSKNLNLYYYDPTLIVKRKVSVFPIFYTSYKCHYTRDKPKDIIRCDFYTIFCNILFFNTKIKEEHLNCSLCSKSPFILYYFVKKYSFKPNLLTILNISMTNKYALLRMFYPDIYEKLFDIGKTYDTSVKLLNTKKSKNEVKPLKIKKN